MEWLLFVDRRHELHLLKSTLSPSYVACMRKSLKMNEAHIRAQSIAFDGKFLSLFLTISQPSPSLGAQNKEYESSTRCKSEARSENAQWMIAFLNHIFLKKTKPMLVSTQCILLTDDNFQTEVLEPQIPVLVDCWASWCGAFHPIDPTIEALAIEFTGQLKVGRLNVCMAEKLAARYGIRVVPTLLLFKNGQVIERVIGSVAKQRLANKLNALLTGNQVADSHLTGSQVADRQVADRQVASSHSSRSRIACL